MHLKVLNWFISHRHELFQFLNLCIPPTGKMIAGLDFLYQNLRDKDKFSIIVDYVSELDAGRSGTGRQRTVAKVSLHVIVDCTKTKSVAPTLPVGQLCFCRMKPSTRLLDTFVC